MLNSFFSAATSIVDERDGVVVNYIGDALIASFNAPLPPKTIRRERLTLLAISLSSFPDANSKATSFVYGSASPPGRWPPALSGARNAIPTRSMAIP